MGQWRKNSKENKIKQELQRRFEERERLSIEEAMMDYLDPVSRYAAVIARQTIGSIFKAVKRGFLRRGVPFGCLNEDLEWGIPGLEEEYRFMGIKRYKLVKGTVINTKIILSSGRRRGYLKKGTEEEVTIFLPNGHDKNDTDKLNKD